MSGRQISRLERLGRLERFKQGIAQFWDSMSDGWHRMRRSVAGALTLAYAIAFADLVLAPLAPFAHSALWRHDFPLVKHQPAVRIQAAWPSA